MVKSHPVVYVVEAKPEGAVTDAPQPLAVQVQYQWSIPRDGSSQVAGHAWALAWTQSEVLVYWRQDGGGFQLVWLKAEQVRRR